MNLDNFEGNGRKWILNCAGSSVIGWLGLFESLSQTCACDRHIPPESVWSGQRPAIHSVLEKRHHHFLSSLKSHVHSCCCGFKETQLWFSLTFLFFQAALLQLAEQPLGSWTSHTVQWSSSSSSLMWSQTLSTPTTLQQKRLNFWGWLGQGFPCFEVCPWPNNWIRACTFWMWSHAMSPAIWRRLEHSCPNFLRITYDFAGIAFGMSGILNCAGLLHWEDQKILNFVPIIYVGLGTSWFKLHRNDCRWETVVKGLKTKYTPAAITSASSA